MKRIVSFFLIFVMIVILLFSFSTVASAEKNGLYANLTNPSEYTVVNNDAVKCYDFNTINDEVVYTYSPEYDMTVTVFGRDACLNSERVIKNIIYSGITDNEKIKVIFVDCDKKTKEQVTSFAEKIGDSNISFCYDTSGKAIDALWDYVKKSGYGKKATIPVTAFIKGDGTLFKLTQGVLESEYIYAYATGDTSGDEIISFDISGKENYDYAFEVLNKVNELRSGLNQNTLIMDEALMNAAMQRAAELSIYYSHIRPNGEDSLAIFSEDDANHAENIAVGQKTPYNVVESWKNSSGHYKNMTNKNFNSIGIGCFTTSDGYLCWVQLFSSAKSTGVSKNGTVVAEHNIKVQKRNLNIGFSAEADMHKLAKNQYTKINVWNCNKLLPYIKQNIIGTQFNYSSSNSDVITIANNGYCTIKGNGTATITVTLKSSDAFSMLADYTVGHVYLDDTDNVCDYCGEKRTTQNVASENVSSKAEATQTSKPSSSKEANSSAVSSVVVETSKPSKPNGTNSSVVSSENKETLKPNSSFANSTSANTSSSVTSSKTPTNSSTTATSKPESVINPDKTQQEQTKPLTTVDYLAFSKLAYLDWKKGQTVGERIDSIKNDVFNKEIIDILEMAVPKTELELYSINYEMLCKNILSWKVIATSKTWGKSKEKGFYAVTFYNESLKQAVVAYRGSTGIDKIKTEDGYNDWIKNDLPFHFANKYTGQLQEAKDYYKYCLTLDDISFADITVTGHSLGGALGQTVSMTYGVYAEVFNSASVFEALYIHTPNEVGPSFKGVDKWNFVSHVNKKDLIGTYGNKYKKLPYVAHEDYYTTLSLKSFDAFISTFMHPHSLQSMIWRDTSTGDIRMSSNSKASVPKGFFIGKKNPLGFGTSADDTLFFADVENSFIKDVRFYGGDGDDLLRSFGNTNDVFVGGASNKGDKLIGGLGDDTYIYNKGDGVQWINDVGGNDTIRLLGFEKADVVTASRVCKFDGIDYKEITLNGNPILYVSLNRSKDDSFNITKEKNTLFSFTGNWKKFYSAYVACPVDVDILDADGNVVMTIKDKSATTEHTEYGNFYVFEDEDGESCKRFDLVEGYSAKIRGVGEGTMDVVVLYNSDNQTMDSVGVKNIPVTNSTTATFKFEQEQQVALLVNDGANQTELLLQKQKTITFDAGEGSCDISSVKTDFSGVIVQLPTPVREGYEFKGWKTSEGKVISVGDTLNSDITLYSDWGDENETTVPVRSSYFSEGIVIIVAIVVVIIGIAVVILTVIIKKRKVSKSENQSNLNT